MLETKTFSMEVNFVYISDTAGGTEKNKNPKVLSIDHR